MTKLTPFSSFDISFHYDYDYVWSLAAWCYGFPLSLTQVWRVWYTDDNSRCFDDDDSRKRLVEWKLMPLSLLTLRPHTHDTSLVRLLSFSHSVESMTCRLPTKSSLVFTELSYAYVMNVMKNRTKTDMCQMYICLLSWVIDTADLA